MSAIDKSRYNSDVSADVYVSQEEREGFAAGSSAALGGGVTTIIDSPNNLSTTVTGVENKVNAAAKDSECDVGFLGGIIPGNVDELVPLLKAGVKGFKCTLTTFDPSFPAVSEDDLKAACAVLPENTLVIVHAELGDSIPLGETPYGQLEVLVSIAFGLFSAEIVKRVYPNPYAFYGTVWITAMLAVYYGFASSQPTPSISFRGHEMSTLLAYAFAIPLATLALYDFAISEPKEGITKLAAIGIAVAMSAGFNKANEFSPLKYSNYLRTRPAQLEDDGLALVARVAEAYPSLRFNVSPLGSASALASLNDEKDISNLTISTSPHYLTFHDAALPPKKFGEPLYVKSIKTHPPIRHLANQQALIKALEDGEITDVVSSHTPTTPTQKEGNFLTSEGGISSLGLTLPLLHTLGFPIARIVDWMGVKQAVKVGLQGRKGEIRVGADADFVVFDPEYEGVISESSLGFQHKHSPYLDRKIRGRVENTYLRGEKVFDVFGSSVKTGLGKVL